jgi:hopanoid-associated phosphorylase
VAHPLLQDQVSGGGEQDSRYLAWKQQDKRPVLAITGLAVEARLTAGPGVITLMAGANPARLRSLCRPLAALDCRAVISFGIAGGLDPSLAPGDVVVATGVAAPDRHLRACLAVARDLATRLCEHPKRVIMADLAGVDRAVVTPLEKRSLRSATGASAVDMESHVAAAFAAQHGLPFAAVRVVCDPANRTLPALVGSALRPDGEVSLTGVFASLCRRPLQLLAMPGLASDAAEGFRALRQCRELLGHGLGISHAVEGEIVKAAV